MSGLPPTTATSSQPPASSLPPAAGVPLPPVVVPQPKPIDSAETDWYAHGQQLGHRLRRIAGYGGLLLALVMYAAGLCAAALFMGLWPEIVPRATGDMWHIVVPTLVALFSVPTVLLLAVLRNTSNAAKDEELDSIHAAVGQKVMDLIEKWIDKN